MLRAVVVVFAVVGLALLGVFAVGAQEGRVITPYSNPYPLPGDGPRLMIGWLSMESTETMTGTFPVTIVMEDTRIDAEGEVTGNFPLDSGWMVRMYVHPKGQ